MLPSGRPPQVGIPIATIGLKEASWTTRRLTMRTHILTYLMASLLWACTSYRENGVTRNPAELKLNQERAQHAQMIDSQASRIP
jgi:hypothetical protein